jgi:hypothetical protein
MPVCANNHNRLLDLFRIICLHDINDIEPAEGRKAVLLLEPTAIGLDLIRNRFGQFLKIFGLPESVG